MARAKKSKATIRHHAKKSPGPGKKKAMARARKAKARPAMKKNKAIVARKKTRAIPAKKSKPAKTAAPTGEKNEFWKVNALITAEIEKIGAGITSREAVEIDGEKKPQRPTGAAKSMLRNKVGFELKLLETEIKSGRMKVPMSREEDEFEDAGLE